MSSLPLGSPERILYDEIHNDLTRLEAGLWAKFAAQEDSLRRIEAEIRQVAAYLQAQSQQRRG